MVIGLICLGNMLHADDGFGPAVHRRLASRRWPDGVRLLDATEGGVLDLLRQCRHAILVTSLDRTLGQPGQVLRLSDDQVPADPQGPLGAGAAAILASMRRLLPEPPATEILGAVALRQIPFSAGLSPLVAAAVETTSAMLWREWGQPAAA
ncbi:MAG: hydrogenase maturation protease [Magnetospirillum gryphiswaldense]|nr:hydrogenase maturation protease [Magnetospirillum gryphiswaldense]